jgi:hypothetical protein
MNLARIATFTDGERWRMALDRALASYLPRMQERPLSMTEALLAVDFVLGPVREIVIALATADSSAGEDLKSGLRRAFCPRKVLVAGTPGTENWTALQARIPMLRDKTAAAERATAFVCTQGHCQLPTSNADEFVQQLIG